jgi:TolB-like protein/AraC-like DNA-binding protein/Tfp pilus assembly protein PilF
MNNQSSIDQPFIRKLTEIIRANLENENFGIKELARETGMSRFNLNRKLQFISRKTINQFIREVRLQRAMEMLLQESVTASEVAFKVGFNSPAYFSTCFSEYFGYPPGEVKKRALNSSEENGQGFSVEPVNIKQESVQTGTNPPGRKKQIQWTIAFTSFGILFIIVIIYFFSPKTFGNINFLADKRLNKQAKSIAVLPFINDSHDPENGYFINGVMEAILDNLSKIKDLEVRPRTSVEQYRNNGTKTVPQIARELAVNYIIEGSGQKLGDQVSLYIQLIETSSDKHLFSNRYNMKLEDIFNLQSEVAIKVASEIKSVITLEEKELIDKPPTASIAAWEMYSRGSELHNIAQLDNNIENERQAEVYFKRAIQLDSTYAEPYVQLGWIHATYNESDSVLFYADKALHFDDKNSHAFALRGMIFLWKGMKKQAEEAFKLAIQYNPNYSSGYRFLSEIYFLRGDSYMAIKNQLKALKLDNNSIEERDNLIGLWCNFNKLGFYEEGKKYAEKLIILTGDSTYYYWCLLSSDLDVGNHESVIKYADKIYNIDSVNLGKLLDCGNSYFLVNTYLNLRDYKEAYRLLEKYTGSIIQQGRKIQPHFYFGFIYLQNGQKEEANFHFEGSIKERLEIIELNKPSKLYLMHLGLTYSYAGDGEKTKALEQLRILNSWDSNLYSCSQITGFKISPLLDCIRKEPEFIEFLKNAEARYQEERRKVGKLLREEGILDSSGK